MINERKVRLMTKTAIYEQGKGREDMKMNTYSGSDYVRFNMFKSLIGATITAVLIFILFAVYEMEQIMNDVMRMDYLKLGKQALTIYIIVLAVYAIASFFVYQQRYAKAEKRLKKYKMNLQKIESISDGRAEER